MKKLILLLLLSFSVFAEETDLTKIKDDKLRDVIIEEKKIKIERDKLELEKDQMDFKQDKLEAEIEYLQTLKRKRQLENELKKEVDNVTYLDDPITNTSITITDRKIVFPEEIDDGTGNFISDQIAFFNRQSNKPIFLIMDVCYGGSVSEGEIILTAIKSSRSKIYIIVKQIAASMCAIIAGHNKHSYTLPNAIILHHQLSGYSRGNTSEQESDAQFTREWEERLLTPIAIKMGITYKEFIKQMYKNSPKGDWTIFGDQAVKLKWIKDKVTTIVDISITKKVEQFQMQQKPMFKFKSNKPYNIYWIKRK